MNFSGCSPFCSIPRSPPCPSYRWLLGQCRIPTSLMIPHFTYFHIFLLIFSCTYSQACLSFRFCAENLLNVFFSPELEFECFLTWTREELVMEESAGKFALLWAEHCHLKTFQCQFFPGISDFGVFIEQYFSISHIVFIVIDFVKSSPAAQNVSPVHCSHSGEGRFRGRVNTQFLSSFAKWLCHQIIYHFTPLLAIIN